MSICSYFRGHEKRVTEPSLFYGGLLEQFTVPRQMKLSIWGGGAKQNISTFRVKHLQ